MNSIPLRARLFLLTTVALGASIVAFLAHHIALRAPAWHLLPFIALAIAVAGKKFTLTRARGANDHGSMSLGFAVTFAAMLYFGSAGGIAVALCGCLWTCVYPRHQPWHQVIFNLSVAALDTGGAGLVFDSLNGPVAIHHLLTGLSAISAAAMTCFLINTGAVSTIIALCTGSSPVAVWRESFLWTGPSYFAGASVSSLALVLTHSSVGGILVFVSPIAYLTYQSYAIYTTRAQEKQQHIERLAGLYLATIKSLALAIDAKDQYTHQHILRVQRYAMATAHHIGLIGDELEGLNTGALLHDIGKLGVPEYVLLKPGRLTSEEFDKIKMHPEIGAAILDPVEFPWPVLPVVKSHHERWDGTGYPEGLKGTDIPLTARILAVADVYDALTSNRAYRKACTHEDAKAQIVAASGTHFDPDIVDAFLEVIDCAVAELVSVDIGEDGILREDAGSAKANEAAQHIQRASSELWALYEVAQTLSASVGLSETLDILARKLGAILPSTACLFMLIDEQSGDLTAHAAVGVNSAFFSACQTIGEHSLSRQVAADNCSYLGTYDIDDLMLSPAPGHLWVPLNSALVVPIVHQGRTLGTINLYHPEANAFAANDRQLLETIAERAALAIFNGLLFDRTRSHALTDPLTGLYNMRHFNDIVEKLSAAATASAEPFSVLCMDLDSFKPINDNFGHQEGDRVLRDLASIFRSVIRQHDVIARYGGDEFVIVLADSGTEEAALMASRLQEAVERFKTGLKHERLGTLYLGVSIGCAAFPEDGRDCASLIAAADSRMYQNKTERKLGKMAGKSVAVSDGVLHLPFAA